MSKVFGKDASRPNNVKRNVFDMSHQNNLTMRFGELYPCLVEPVIPGDSFQCDVAFGIRALPTAFPVQTKIRVDTHFFYVRNRNLWKDWQNFIGMTGNTDAYKLPTVKGKHATGSLADYLGVPTTVVGEVSDRIKAFRANVASLDFRNTSFPSKPDNYGSLEVDFETLTSGDFHSIGTPENFDSFPVVYNNGSTTFRLYSLPFVGLESLSREIHLFKGSVVKLSGSFPNTPFSRAVLSALESGDAILTVAEAIIDDPNLFNLYDDTVRTNRVTNSFGAASVSLTTDFSADFTFNLTDSVSLSSGYRFVIISRKISSDGSTLDPFVEFEAQPTSDVITIPGAPYLHSLEYSFDDVVDASTSSVPIQDINALPFRAYESIYNSFYRDQRNNPYIVDGVHDPNVYLPTTDGGFDTYPYSLRKRNWEQDFMTSAVPSPQQGTAPLVGVTSTGVAKFANEDGTTTSVKLTTADDGDTVTGAEFSDDTPNSVARSIVNLATSGFSISDFRGVNALTRWLEINMRRGLKYKDQILSHFGVDVHYNVLDMPEFIGGVTQWFDSSQINQTSASDISNGDPLGSYAGQLSAVGGNNHTIRQFCDEHGYIIGIVSIVPVPVYDQLLPKDFIKSSPLDFFFPEFGHLGFQPVSYTEVAPYQAQLFGVNPSDVFGYQRAWYEYLARTDEAHGEFRTYFRDFLLARKFKNVPSLSPDFLTVSPDQLNNVFTVSEFPNGDGSTTPVMPFLGQIHFKEFIKRPIPRYGTPKLEPDI